MYATMEKSMVNFNKTQTDRIFQFDHKKYIFWPYCPAVPTDTMYLGHTAQHV